MVSQFKLPEIGSDIADDESITQEQEEASNKQDAFNVLRLDASTFKDFAPHYYQNRSLVFSEPFKVLKRIPVKSNRRMPLQSAVCHLQIDEKQNHWAAQPLPKLPKLDDLVQA